MTFSLWLCVCIWTVWYMVFVVFCFCYMPSLTVFNYHDFWYVVFGVLTVPIWWFNCESALWTFFFFFSSKRLCVCVCSIHFLLGCQATAHSFNFFFIPHVDQDLHCTESNRITSFLLWTLQPSVCARPRYDWGDDQQHPHGRHEAQPQQGQTLLPGRTHTHTYNSEAPLPSQFPTRTLLCGIASLYRSSCIHYHDLIDVSMNRREQPGHFVTWEQQPHLVWDGNVSIMSINAKERNVR